MQMYKPKFKVNQDNDKNHTNNQQLQQLYKQQQHQHKINKSELVCTSRIDLSSSSKWNGIEIGIGIDFDYKTIANLQ